MAQWRARTLASACVGPKGSGLHPCIFARNAIETLWPRAIRDTAAIAAYGSVTRRGLTALRRGYALATLSLSRFARSSASPGTSNSAGSNSGRIST